MNKKSTSTTPATKPSAVKSVVEKSVKQKAAAYVNWRIANPEGETVLRSAKGFALYLNEYITRPEKALIELAKQNGGSATVMAELRIVLHTDEDKPMDISGITLIK